MSVSYYKLIATQASAGYTNSGGIYFCGQLTLPRIYSPDATVPELGIDKDLYIEILDADLTLDANTMQGGELNYVLLWIRGVQPETPPIIPPLGFNSYWPAPINNTNTLTYPGLMDYPLFVGFLSLSNFYSGAFSSYKLDTKSGMKPVFKLPKGYKSVTLGYTTPFLASPNDPAKGNAIVSNRDGRTGIITMKITDMNGADPNSGKTGPVVGGKGGVLC
jgi:hypothetical protein